MNASIVLGIIANRQQLLKLLAMNNCDMEANSRPELLVSFKVAYGQSMKNICMIITKFCPEKTVQEICDRRLTKDEDFDIGSDFADYLKRSY